MANVRVTYSPKGDTAYIDFRAIEPGGSAFQWRKSRAAPRQVGPMCLKIGGDTR